MSNIILLIFLQASLLVFNLPANEQVVVIDKKFPLMITAKPKGARIKITNIKPRYSYGIELKPGKYRVEVSHKGYESADITFNLQKPISHEVVLKRIETKVAVEKPILKPNEEVFWKQITDSNTKELYQLYLEEYPNGYFTKEAKNILEEMEQQLKIQREHEEREKIRKLQKADKDAWDTIDQSIHPEDYESYLKEYPNGMFTSLAKFKIKKYKNNRKFSLTIHTSPLDSIIKVEGHPEYKNGDKLKQGSYMITVSQEGYASKKDKIVLDENKDINIFLESIQPVHNGMIYNEVVSPYTGRIWLDRNLGAKQVCKSKNDHKCYGYLFQWGRSADGHQEPDSKSFTSVNKAPWDWEKSDTDGRKRKLFWAKFDGSGICPVGFRVPTLDELKNETINQGVNNADEAFKSFLKLPVAGHRSFYDGSLYEQNENIYLWTSSPFQSLYFKHFKSGEKKRYPSFGYTVRCIKN